MGRLRLLAELQRFAYGGSNAGLGFAQHVPLVVYVRHEESCLYADDGLQV